MLEHNGVSSTAVIGGGITGIAASLFLAARGHHVVLFEKRDHLGGMCDTYCWPEATADRFYHVILSNDSELLGFISDLGLEGAVFWKKTKSGFYDNGRLVSLSSIGDFVSFPFLSLWQKLRLGLGILASANVKDPVALDRVSVQEWLIRIFGRTVYEQIWDPLLRSKLGEARHQTSAAFIWATISRLYGARTGGARTEQMGHVHGGYATILKAAEGELRGRGVEVRLSEPVQELSSGPALKTKAGLQKFDSVLMTIPCSAATDLVGENASRDDYWQRVRRVRYLGVICLFLALDRQLSPYYVTNILDKSLPFTGIIESTNVIDPSFVGNRHLVYLPKYVTSDDPLNQESDIQVFRKFRDGLKKVFPDLADSSIVHQRVFRERCAQPLQELGYLDMRPEMRTPVPGVWLANTSLIYNSTLNNNAAIGIARRAVKEMTHEDT